MGSGTKLFVCSLVTTASLTLMGCSSRIYVVSTPNQWTWINGSNVANQKGTYGTQGTSASSNVPGARSTPVSWTDAAGNFWLFGGTGYDSAGTQGQLNDLWEYSRGQWTWIDGANVANQKGTYGTQGTAASANTPGARSSALSWTDGYGNLWLFGGTGYDSAGTQGQLNDLWEFSRGQWTWMGGSNVANQKGTYGTQGTAASANTPGARSSALSWTDGYGNLWLFGGTGYDASGTQGPLNDLWEYTKSQWTWVGGSNAVNQAGTYGTKGTAAASNLPGARSEAAGWTDAFGNLWLFGGSGYDASGTQGQLNDLWKYSRGQWTWMSGANSINQAGTYGTQGTAASSNVPGARSNALAWTDPAGNLWLFGGSGPNSSGAQGAFNDLWVYSRGGWVWINGSNSTNQMGTYGTQGKTASSNLPGARSGAVGWVDGGGNLWLFGGLGYDSAGTNGKLNDLWVY